jgi:hypothetical protein
MRYNQILKKIGVEQQKTNFTNGTKYTKPVITGWNSSLFVIKPASTVRKNIFYYY